MKKIGKFLSYVVVAALASLLTLALVMPNLQKPEALKTSASSKLDQLADLIDECFIGDVDRTTMEDAAANAMIDSIGDRWSYYIPKAQYQTYLDDVNNSYVGIGVTIQVRDDVDGFTVTKVNAGGPAEDAGLLVGDIIVAVDAVDVRGMTTNETSALVKGTEGTFVEITVERQGAQHVFSVERRHVDVPVATYQMLEGNVGHVMIANFHKGCAEQSIAAIEELRKQGATSLILDVRNNGGGYASELVELLDYLLPEGLLFRTVNYLGEETTDYSDADYLDMPMAVMVNGSSYSAAEFFAVALSEYEAAVVVGEKTVGKGYYQVNYQLSDGSAVSLSIGQYFTPKGNNLAGVGITPDIEIPVDEQTATQIALGTIDPTEDPQLQAAVAALKSQ